MSKFGDGKLKKELFLPSEEPVVVAAIRHARKL